MYHDILRKGFESLSVWLYYCDGNITGFPGFDVSYDAGLACMDAADDFALNAVS